MSGRRSDVILDDRTLVELIGGIALDLLENNYVEQDLARNKSDGKKSIYPVEIFKRKMNPIIKMFSGVTVTSLMLFGVAAVVVKKLNHTARA